MIQHNNKYGTIINGDCIDVMDKLIEDGVKVDCVITDIPQAITKNSWDSIIPFKEMWDKLYKLRRDKSTPIILLTNQPFTSDLINSNRKHFKVMKYWQKDRPSGFLNAKKMPLKDIEEIAVFSESPNEIIIKEMLAFYEFNELPEESIKDIVVFYEKQCTYNPQFWEGKPLHGMGTKYKEKTHKNNNYNSFESRKNPSANRTGDTKKFPRQLLKYNKPHPPKHPTEKPISLIEDLLLTYSNEGDLVLDFTSGTCTLAEACILSNRKYICIELNSDYYNIGVEDIKKYELKNVDL